PNQVPSTSFESEEMPSSDGELDGSTSASKILPPAVNMRPQPKPYSAVRRSGFDLPAAPQLKGPHASHCHSRGISGRRGARARSKHGCITMVFLHGSKARQHDTVLARLATENPALKGRRLGRWQTDDLSRSLWHHGKEQERREDG